MSPQQICQSALNILASNLFWYIGVIEYARDLTGFRDLSKNALVGYNPKKYGLV